MNDIDMILEDYFDPDGMGEGMLFAIHNEPCLAKLKEILGRYPQYGAITLENAVELAQLTNDLLKIANREAAEYLKEQENV